MRYRLRTLLILLAVLPLVIALFVSRPGLAFALLSMASVLATIYYWPQLCGKGG